MVFCYRNLNRKGIVWSVRSKKTGRVICRAPIVVLKDVQFRVSEAGRMRVLRSHRKNVHAGAQGTWVRSWTHEELGQHDWVRVSYNPYLAKSFIHRGKPIHQAKKVVLRQDGAWAVL